MATKKTADERKELLARQIASMLPQGMRVESQSDYQAVLLKGKRVNHILHAILSVFTGFLWAPVWIILAITGGEKRQIVSVDEFGNVMTTQA